MKKLTIGSALLAAAFFLTGCIVSSIYPFYLPKDVVDPAPLLGRWNTFDPDRGEITNEFVEFQKFKKSSCLMVMGSGETNSFIANLFEIKGRQFLDHQAYLTNRDFGFGFTPEHFICSVSSNTNSLRLAWMSQDWLETLLKTNANAIRYTTVYDDPDDAKGRIVLTADTPELQKFLLKYIADTNAFTEMQYRRAKE